MNPNIVYKKYLGDGAWYFVIKEGEDKFDIYDIPIYGGEGIYHSSHKSLDEAIAAGDKLT